MSEWVTCPNCEGRGEVYLGADYFGMPETKPCSLCEGREEVRPEVAADYFEQAFA